MVELASVAISELLLDRSSFNTSEVVTSVAFAFKSKAVCVAVEIGLSASLMLLTFSRPTFAGFIPIATLASVTDPSANLIAVT